MQNSKTRYSAIVIVCCSFISVRMYAQTNTAQSEPASSGIVQLPIGTTKSTDPNYETNLAKYKDFKEYVPPVETPVVKDEAYYLKKISDLKNEIAEKENMAPDTKTAEVLQKIETIKSELDLTEDEYKQFKK